MLSGVRGISVFLMQPLPAELTPHKVPRLFGQKAISVMMEDPFKDYVEVQTPFNELFDNLKRLLRLDWLGFDRIFQSLHQQMVVLDEAPRHDTLLSDEECQRAIGLGVCGYQHTFVEAARELRLASEAMARAMGAVEGIFRGDLKVKLEDRLARQLRETQELVDLYESAWQAHRHPRQPFAIRQQSLGLVCGSMNDFIDRIKEMKAIAELSGASEIVPVLQSLLTQLCRLRAELSKYRDNPSQKMGKRAAHWSCVMDEVFAQLNRIGNKCKFEMLRRGVLFSGRCGTLTAKWLPSMADDDPWTFDSEPHMQAYWSAVEG